MTPSRRSFLGAAGASMALGPALAPRARPRVAALASTYHYLSHAYHIVGRVGACLRRQAPVLRLGRGGGDGRRGRGVEGAADGRVEPARHLAVPGAGGAAGAGLVGGGRGVAGGDRNLRVPRTRDLAVHG